MRKGANKLKALFRILVITTILTFVFYKYSQNSSAPPPKPDEDATFAEWQEYASEALPRPTKGVSTLIGKSSVDILTQYGEPKRTEASAYGYEWWTYNDDATTFTMIALEQDIVKQVYIAGRSVKTDPFTLGSTLDDVYRTSIIEPEVMLNYEEQLYTLALTDYDLKHRLLVKFDDIVAQVFVDAQQEVTAIRFFDYATIIKLQPYELAYYEGALQRPIMDAELQSEVIKGVEAQAADLLAVQRYYKLLPVYRNNELLKQLAQTTVQDYVKQRENENEARLSLQERAQAIGILTPHIAETTEEISFDAIEMMHRMFNEDESKEVLLNKEYTHYGIACLTDVCTHIAAKREQVKQAPMNEQSER